MSADADAAESPILNSLADGLPTVVQDAATLAQTVAALAAGTGPVAVDTERAQSFRYGSQAYLLQWRRAGAGTHLIDPIAFTDADGVVHLEELNEALQGAEWIIHAASQDLPCLRMAGLYPQQLFDTELAGRLLGFDRVGLGPMIERFFGLRLLKEHSAANWSQRPIPEGWLLYAALDVELLVELRDRLIDELDQAGKLQWAHQEFAHVLASFRSEPEPRKDPWRRTSGIQSVKSPRGMAVVRELWLARDQVAQRLDLAPSKVLQDKAITELASLVGRTGPLPGRDQMRRIDGFKRRQAFRHESTWVNAVASVEQLGGQLPPLRAPREPGEIPHPRSWERHDPEAWARWNRTRPTINAIAERLNLPPENLLAPEALRQITYRPPAACDEASVDAALTGLGVRAWQREQVLTTLTQALKGNP